MQLEDGQIIRRSLDRDFPFSRPHVAWAVFRPAFVSEDRLYSLQVQEPSTAIDQGLEDLLHAPANLQRSDFGYTPSGSWKEVIPKPAASLFLKVERKTQTGAVNPPLTRPPTQSPYGPLFGQGLTAIFAKPDVLPIAVKQLPSLMNLMPDLAGLAGNVIHGHSRDHLGWEWRDAHLILMVTCPQSTVENMERVVVHIRLLPLEVVIRLDVPYRCLGATDQDQKLWKPSVTVVLAR